MREKVVIQLKKPLRSPQGDVHQIVLREPTFDEYLSHGDPYEVAYTSDNVRFAVEQTEVIKRYIGVCLVEPKDPATLAQGGAWLAREVKEALLGFFRRDNQESPDEGEASGTSQTTSPSPGSGQTASTTSES